MDDNLNKQDNESVNSHKKEIEDSKKVAFDPEAFEATKNLVAIKTSQADELRHQIREVNEGLRNILENDPQLASAEEKAAEVKLEVTKRKKTLHESPEAISIKTKLRDFKEDLKDVEESLSTQLLNLYTITGVKEFETAGGDVREFDIKAKVKAKKQNI